MTVSRIKHFLLSYWPEIVLLLLFGWIFFYRLGGDPLENWDEGWYATIAQTMADDGDFLTMKWLSNPFVDHPPLSIWLQSLSIWVFGGWEFSVRLHSALLGLGTMIVLYRLGLALFDKKMVGFAASFILGTSLWYVLRVRSGNMDSTLVFFYVLTVFLAFLSRRNIRMLPFTLASFGALMISKSLVGLAAIVVIVFWNWHHLVQIKKTWKMLAVGVGAFCAVVMPWYGYTLIQMPGFLSYQLFGIAMRNREAGSFLNISFEQPLFYLFIGVRKWYKMWLVGMGVLLVRLSWLKAEVAGLFVWLIVVLYPFLTKDMTGIWHLLPVYPPLALLTAYGIYELYQTGFDFFKTKTYFLWIRPWMLTGVYLVTFAVVGIIQIKNLIPDVIPHNYYVPPEVDVSRQLSDYPGDVFLNDEWLPVANFYSKRLILMLKFNSGELATLEGMLLSGKPAAIITPNDSLDWLDQHGVDYSIYYRNDGFSVVTSNL